MANSCFTRLDPFIEQKKSDTAFQSIVRVLAKSKFVKYETVLVNKITCTCSWFFRNLKIIIQQYSLQNNNYCWIFISLEILQIVLLLKENWNALLLRFFFKNLRLCKFYTLALLFTLSNFSRIFNQSKNNLT